MKVELMTTIENKISKFMLTFSKFEFFVINQNSSLSKKGEKDSLEIQKISGIDWNVLANKIEGECKFSTFEFQESKFLILKETPPQYLVVNSEGVLKWDKDERPIEDWRSLLTRGLGQLRNNIAHGSKLLSAPSTQDRTEKLLTAGYELIKFITKEILGNEHWETGIIFEN